MNKSQMKLTGHMVMTKDSLFKMMDEHAVDFLKHLIDQGKIKIHFRGDTPESLYKQFNEGRENQNGV